MGKLLLLLLSEISFELETNMKQEKIKEALAQAQRVVNISIRH